MVKKNFTRAVDRDVSIGADHDGEAFCPTQLRVTAAASHGGHTRIRALVGDSPGRDNKEGEEEELHLAIEVLFWSARCSRLGVG